MNKRNFLRTGFLLAASAVAAPAVRLFANRRPDMIGEPEEIDFVAGNFTLPKLPYDVAALEPHIDKMTMEIHHGRHHNAYVNNLNKAVEGTDYEKMDLEQLVKSVKAKDAAVRNNGGGHYNHSMFWTLLSPSGGGPATGKVGDMISKQWGSFDKFKEAFNQAGMGRFGSGWAWLCVGAKGNLFISSTPNQDNPLMKNIVKKEAGTPILGVDVWEHAYYLKYQNKRADYLAAFWNLVNWDEVNRRLG